MNKRDELLSLIDLHKTDPDEALRRLNEIEKNIKPLRGGDYRIEGMIRGMESQGAIFIKIENGALFFDVPKKSELNDEKILLAAQAISGLTGLKLRIKRL